jgi:hypothetical protein
MSQGMVEVKQQAVALFAAIAKNGVFMEHSIASALIWVFGKSSGNGCTGDS